MKPRSDGRRIAPRSPPGTDDSAADGRSIGYGELTAGRKLAGVVAADATPRWTLGTARHRSEEGRRPRIRHGRPPVHARPGPAEHGMGASSDRTARRHARVRRRQRRARDDWRLGRPRRRVPRRRSRPSATRRAAAAVGPQWRPPANEPTSETIYDHLKNRGVRRRTRAATPHIRGRRRARASARTRSRRLTAFPTSRTCRSSPAPPSPSGQDGKLTVWSGTQRPFGVRAELAEAFRIPEDRVRVIVPDTGSAYGGKHSGEHAIEAARLAKAAASRSSWCGRAPEEFSWAYFRPAGVIEIKRGGRRGRAAGRVGVPQLELGRVGDPHALRRSQPAHRVPSGPTRRCARARIAAWPRPRTTTRARCTWTRSRARWASTRRVPAAT